MTDAGHGIAADLPDLVWVALADRFRGEEECALDNGKNMPRTWHGNLGYLVGGRGAVGAVGGDSHDGGAGSEQRRLV